MTDLAERVQRVRTLLETLEDPYPRPHGALRSDSGPAASRYVPCETCRRTGWIRRRRLQVLCLACDGSGWRRRQRDEGEWDAYLGLPVQEAVQLPVEAPHRPRELGVGEESPYAWERLRRAYESRGSYRELRVQLAWLSVDRPRRHHLIRRVLVEAQPVELQPVDRAEIDLGVVAITLRMRSVRVPPWLLEHEQRDQNQSVFALASAGYKPGQIAARLGIPTEVVKRKMRRQRQAGKPAAGARMISVSGGA